MAELLLNLPPGILLILGGLLLPLIPGNARKAVALLLPAASFAHLVSLPLGHHTTFELMQLTLHPVHIDKLALVWGYVFHIAAFLATLYALHAKDGVQDAAAAGYAGSAIAAAFAGDLLTLFVWWEVTAITSVFLIWARHTPRASKVGLRYLLIQVTSGVVLLAGVMAHHARTGEIAFAALDLAFLDGKLILLAFGIKCAFPFLHNWLQDGYPEATVTGTVVLSAFTTKLAVYALARGFAGTDILIPIGLAMTLFPIVFAVIENDLRRVLAYSLNNQLGFMVVGVGIGTEMALNGTAAHAFAHIIYKALLFMAMGAVLHRTGTIKASQLGGLYKSMPWTTVFCIIGSLSISGFPLFSGFVSKSMTLTAVADQHLLWVSVGLLVASAGVVDHSGIKIPFFAFFAHDQGHRVKEAPLNMLLAMGGASVICIGLGLYPAPLYAILPFPVDYVPYTASHVITSLQLLMFAALAFAILWRWKKYPPELRAINLDTDWLYRRFLPWVVHDVKHDLARAHATAWGFIQRSTTSMLFRVSGAARPPGVLGEPWSTNATALFAAILLFVCLVLYFV